MPFQEEDSAHKCTKFNCIYTPRIHSRSLFFFFFSSHVRKFEGGNPVGHQQEMLALFLTTTDCSNRKSVSGRKVTGEERTEGSQSLGPE